MNTGQQLSSLMLVAQYQGGVLFTRTAACQRQLQEAHPPSPSAPGEVGEMYSIISSAATLQLLCFYIHTQTCSI